MALARRAMGWKVEATFNSVTQQGNASSTTNGTIDHDVFGRPGPCYKAVMNGSRQGYSLNAGVSGIAGSNKLTARVYVCMDALPTGHYGPLCAFATSGANSSSTWFVVRCDPSGNLEAGFQSTTDAAGHRDPVAIASLLTTSAAGTVKSCARRWIRIDMKLDLSANPWVANWSINGIPQAQVTRAQTATTWSGFFVHLYSINWTVPINSWTCWSNDVLVDDDTANYPYGPGYSELVLLNGVGTHSNPTHFRNEDGSAINSTSWQRLANGAPPLQTLVAKASANDGHAVECFGPFNNADYLEFTLADIFLDNDSIACVMGWQETYQSNPAPSLIVFDYKILDGSNAVLAQNGTSGTATADQVLGSPIAVSGTSNFGDGIPPSGSWSESYFNGLKLRIGPRNNGSTGNNALSTTYYGATWFALEVHRLTNIERYAIGCPQPRRNLLGAGL